MHEHEQTRSRASRESQAEPERPEDATGFEEAFLLAYLRDRDAPCPLCEYNLRGLTSDRCPECGNRLQLHVALTEPYLAAWLVAAATTCLGAGAGVFVLCIVTANGWPDNRFTLLQVSLIYFIAMIPAAALLLRFRRAFLRLPRPRQRVIATACAAITLGGFLLFLVVI